ncbi:hypothetical protein [Leptospira jelokensis]|uniref:hypothetical protein n=1 Tax=Leptospira jelokensis TaxID=2484931 RepID=UPI001090E90C|nr:hypothetical protein [Leptospira jelokensis]TGM03245.1 hypothetical protein EHQ79_06680 [Leptospira jelokensis]
MTESEKLLKELGELSFLRMWSHSSPIRNDNKKEFCDLLVYTKDTIIIFSIKDIKLSANGDDIVKEKRWNRKAIEESVKQIYGAERALQSNIEVIGNNKKLISIKITENTKVYRIAVAFGSEGKFDYKAGNFGSGFVHVFDEISTLLLFKELSTIVDFVTYLDDKEKFYKKCHVILEREIDQLAHYLMNGRTFPDKYNSIIFENGIWEEYIGKIEYKAKIEEDKKSYFWDQLIEHFIFHEFNGSLESNESSIEESLRLLSYENRFNRRVLSDSLIEFITNSQDSNKQYCRTSISPSNVVYIFLILDINSDPIKLRTIRRDILEKRCVVTRTIYPNSKNIIGIGLNPNIKILNGIDLIYFHLETLNEEFTQYANEIRELYGFHKNTKFAEKNIKEYPEF